MWRAAANPRLSFSSPTKQGLTEALQLPGKSKIPKLLNRKTHEPVSSHRCSVVIGLLYSPCRQTRRS